MIHNSTSHCIVLIPDETTYTNTIESIQEPKEHVKAGGTMGNLDKERLDSYLQKSRLLGFEIEEINWGYTSDVNLVDDYYIIHMSKDKHSVLIPDEASFIGGIKGIDKLIGTIKVVGGSGLNSSVGMFSRAFSIVPQSDLNIIDIAELDTSNVERMDTMFFQCLANTIDLRNLDTSKAVSMEEMFAYSRMKNLDFSKFNTSKVTSMSRMFSNCKTNYLDLRSFNTEKVTEMNEMFNSCNAKHIDLSSFNTSNVESMYSMFQNCETDELDLRSFDTSKVEDMLNMFCNTIIKNKSLDLSSFNTESVGRMRRMFAGCEAEMVDLTSFKTDHINKNNIWGMFSGYSGDIKTFDEKIKKQYMHSRTMIQIQDLGKK